MKPLKFKEQNCIFAENQPPYLPLPSFKSKDGLVTSCWGLNFIDRIHILIYGKVFVTQMTFYKPLQPLMVTYKIPFLTQRISLNNEKTNS